MDAGELESTQAADAELRKNEPARRRLRIALGCLGVTTLFCLVFCGLGGLAAMRHHDDVVHHRPPPRPAVDGENDPHFRWIAEARATAGAAADESCVPVTAALAERFERERPEAALAFHEWLRDRLAELDTQAMREACQAVGYGGCSPYAFIRFRAYLVAMGRPTFALAKADDDRGLARILPRDPHCEDLLELARAYAARSPEAPDAGGAADAGNSTDGGVALDGNVPREAGGPLDTRGDANAVDIPRLDEATDTRLLPRSELPSAHPHLCRRFSCTARDVFELER